jgi:Sec-independent protein translocase protein TatA
MRTLIIIILVLLVVGLYYAPEITKSMMKTTGKVVVDVGKEGIEQVKETEAYKNVTESIKGRVSNIIVIED